jgi:hypothetical protein
LLNRGVDSEEKGKMTIAERMLANMESDERKKERARILEQEMTISDF